jgi:hypothetical protein
MEDRFYKPSGRFGSMTFPLLLLVSLVVLPVLAYIYAYLSDLIPLIYAKFFITLGYALGAGMVLSFWVLYGKIRNGTVYYIGALVALLLAYYISWVTFFAIQTELNFTFLDLAVQPTALKSMIELYNSIGIETTSRGSKSTTNGTMLYVIWLIEFAVMVIGPIFVSFSSYSKPFSELNGDWFTENKLPRAFDFPYIALDEIKMALENSDYSHFDKAIAVNVEEQPAFYKVSIFDSTGDDDYITLKRVTVTYEKGKKNEAETNVVEHLRVPNSVCQKLLSQWG